jgi:hypothetical protein
MDRGSSGQPQLQAPGIRLFRKVILRRPTIFTYDSASANLVAIVVVEFIMPSRGSATSCTGTGRC